MKRRTRSRAGTSRDDRRNVHQGRLYGMTPFHVILTMLLVRIWSFGFYEACTRKNGTDAKGPSVPIFAYSAQRFLGTRSRTGALRDDRRGAHQGILTKLLVKIFVYIAKNGTDVRRIVSPYFRLVIQMRNLWAYSEDGGPLTENVVFTAVSRIT
ncbi:hypothetical protein Theba_1166 [Mesotoga prima MesG1.Ag.4.2]|uniref:Uncharacterized protein n=1 Tax=Mesotoga prima MesG1.Ag.4.2 TaxID=660470 RepID=I2F4L1_9BACT|nr:hypothetical protein Theba_1166 [Mesotoga prima MesG1.Ag.4.2]